MPPTIEQTQEVLGRMNDQFHDMLQEAQGRLQQGMPLNILALFFAVQIDLVANERPEFVEMILAGLDHQRAKRVQSIN